MSALHCVICADALQPHSEYRWKSTAWRAIYDGAIYACRGCGLRQADTRRVGDLMDYYRHQYRSSGIGGNSKHSEVLWYLARAEALAKIAVTTNPSSVFEVGAGYGYNLLAIKEAMPSCRIASDEPDDALDQRVIREQLSGPYDLVLMSHVLEHFQDPFAELMRVGKSLKPGGTLVIEVPHDTDAALTYQPFHEPHLTFFTPESLKALLSRARFTIRNVYACGPAIRPPTLANRVLNRVRGLLGHDFSVEREDGMFLRAVVRCP